MNLVLVSAQFVFIAVFAVLAIGDITGEVEVKSFTAPFFESGMDVGAIFAGAAILALSFLGFDAVSTLSEETDDPRWRIPQGDPAVRARRAGPSTSSSPTSGISRSPTSPSFADHQDVASADVMESIGGDFLNSFFTAAYVAGASPARWPARRASRASCSR